MSLWLKALLIASIVAGIFGYGWTGGKASERKDWLAKQAEQVKAQLAATEAARAKEQAWQFQLSEAQRNGQLEKDKAARVIASLRTELGSMRESLASFTSPRPDDSATAFSERCATTGSLLETALRTSETCAIEGESVSSALREVLAAWPKQDR